MRPRHAAALALVVWYLTMHDAKTQLLIDNPINRRYCAAVQRDTANVADTLAHSPFSVTGGVQNV